ncbi:potassium transporter TrkG [Lignipirellula cremea]|uniref:Ktr system potassium uptake protein B n=1 Tax=Lignipirellula cremea TaxID=2528010 RepID=A0A518DMK6_9BACT|nr:potassium transporter TrkG [Lignipirellula cremea]QDU93051.1 Ktr system potassium uptake protein B [Lignipirellula cremea]
MPQITGSVTKYPARASLCWYLGLILVGGLILWQPFCHLRLFERLDVDEDQKISLEEISAAPPRLLLKLERADANGDDYLDHDELNSVGGDYGPVSLIDAVFTSTSAACVTGLSVRSTEYAYTVWGQLTILLLIQLGGIGIMTVTTFVLFHFGSRESLRHRVLVAETLGADDATDLRAILRNVILLTVICEGLGFVILAIRNLFLMPPVTALWHALFHSISAFCNAGFSLNDNSLVAFQDDVVVNFTISALVIVGGLGYPVIFDLKRNWTGPWRDRWSRLHIHSKIMLIGATVLLVFGTVSFLAIEWQVALGKMSIPHKFMVAFFHSMSCRTAGFNTIELKDLSNASLFITIGLMAIGAGPCSTGGGMKVTTAAVLVMRAWATLRGYTRVNAFRRTIPRAAVERATTTVIIFGLVASVALTLLLVLDQSRISHQQALGLFLEALFEVVSALGTVGLSVGLTGSLSWAGKMVIILLMFLGRLGPISAFVAISRSQREERFEYPNEEPMNG